MPAFPVFFRPRFSKGRGISYLNEEPVWQEKYGIRGQDAFHKKLE